jgi:prepilin-type processing-associated H-X9-DG protein
MLAATDYLGVSGTNAETRDGLFTADQRVRVTDILDGTSQTLLVGERGFRKGALEVIDTSDDINNLRFGHWFSAPGQRNGSVGVVLGTRELNFGSGISKLPWERDCPPGPYRFGPPGQIRDATGSIREECDLFHFWSWHPGGANFLFTDGSVHFLAYGADAVLPALGTRAGGEVVTLP